MKKRNNKIEKTKVPLYVSTYEKLYDIITNSDLKAGEKLPGEHSLADTLGVSRGTLRQALLLLQEDGIIYNRQGIGNFIVTNTDDLNHGLEKTSLIPLEFSKKECEVILDKVIYQPATKIVQENLQLDQPELVVLFELLFVSDDEIIASMDLFILYEVLSQNNISLDDRDSMKEFVLDYVSAFAANSHANIRIVEAREYVAESLEVTEGTPLMCFYEIMYSDSGTPNVYSKSYCIPVHFDFYLNRK